jgi:hypothetical protein
MGDLITMTNIIRSDSVNQGDILKDIEFIEYIKDEDNVIEISNIVFPKVIVLSQ